MLNRFLEWLDEMFYGHTHDNLDAFGTAWTTAECSKCVRPAKKPAKTGRK